MATQRHQVNKKAYKVVLITLVMLVAGFLIGFQFEQVRHAGRQAPQVYSDLDLELQNQLLEIRQQNALLRQELTRLQLETTELEKVLSQRESSTQRLYQQLQQARMLAGEVPVTGRGIEIVLADSPLAAQLPPEQAADYLVQAGDIRAVVTDLLIGGAEAIAVNGERLGARAAIYSEGPVIFINGKQVKSPFVIQAIGPPELMQSAMNFPGGVLDYLRKLTLQVSMKTVEELQLPASSGERRMAQEVLDRS